MAFGELIKCIRKELGITQEELARELNVSFSTINRWENGHRIPKKMAIVCLIDFCKKNKVDIDVIAELEKIYITRNMEANYGSRNYEYRI